MAWWWLVVVWLVTLWATVLVLALCRAASDPLLEAMDAIDDRREGREMSGLYNVLFGQDARAADLLAALGLRRADFYRYRDCYLAEFAGARVIAVYTRGGGGNRECWDEVTLCSEETHAAGCVVTLQEAMRRHPLYLADADDDFDSTYATFYFRLPAAAAQLATAQDSPRGSAAWEGFFEGLRAAGEGR